MNNMGDACWSELPVDLLELIEEYVVLYVDKIRLRCVCTNWLSGLSQLPNLRRQQQPPWLLLPYNSNNSELGSSSLCGLYHPFENKVYEIDLPEAGEKVFRGSDFGWVVTVLENGCMYVVNPLSRVRHELPPRYTFPNVVGYHPDKLGEEFVFSSYLPSGECYTEDSIFVRDFTIRKIALSCNPSLKNDFTVVAIYSSDRMSRLAYCKCGDNKWLELDTADHGCKDAIFCDEKLYAFTARGDLMICDDINSCPKLTSFVPRPRNGSFGYASIYLVNSSTNRLMAVFRGEESHKVASIKDYPNAIFNTDDFEMYELDMAEKRWIELKSFGREIVFMGLGSKVGDSFERKKGNQIYFVSDKLYFYDRVEAEAVANVFDNGIFNIEDKRIDPLGYVCNPKVIWPCPIWVTPNPY